MIMLLAVLIASSASDLCVVDLEQNMSLSFSEFDQESGAGWRALEERGCQLEAANLIQLYRREHEVIPSSEVSLLFWHEGQMRAISGDYASAVPLLLKGVPEKDFTGFTDYALGTVSFLRGDLEGLKAARDHLAATPEPDAFKSLRKAKNESGQMPAIPAWPPNIEVLNGLITCFGKPYKVAYNCRAVGAR